MAEIVNDGDRYPRKKQILVQGVKFFIRTLVLVNKIVYKLVKSFNYATYIFALLSWFSSFPNLTSRSLKNRS